MRFTRKDLIDAKGLKPGDKIKAKNGRKIYTINDEYYLVYDDDCKYSPFALIDEEFEIVPPIKKVGEQLCSKINCADCPLHGINCILESKGDLYPSLYDVLEVWHKEYKDDKLYDFLKARLDKEINDEK